MRVEFCLGFVHYKYLQIFGDCDPLNVNIHYERNFINLK